MLTDPEAEWYVMDLSERAGLKPGRIYPTLGDLLELGWIDRRWEDTSGLRRRLYRLTERGRKRATQLPLLS